MGPVRILLVSQMYPGERDPDLGVFVRDMGDALRDRGHDVELAVLDRRGGGKRRFLELARRVRAAPVPDVVYAHFLVPTGLIASRVDAPLVVTAHGRDVRNVGAIPGVAALTRRGVERAAAVLTVWDDIRREREAKVPGARDKTHVIDMGVDLRRFHPGVTPARTLEQPAFVCAGSLTARKNVVRLADAFGGLGEGSLTCDGDGPLRAQLEGRERVRVIGRVAHDAVPGWLAAAGVVCQPSLIEPFGQSLLEALACGRPVVATRIGGPPEFVPADAGVLVDPTDVPALERALRAAASLPRPNDGALAAAAAHDVRRQAERVEAVLEQAVRGRPA
jgi:glycosyltransferase involved in cell wall biosynthesis